jgi:hypothetical protein
MTDHPEQPAPKRKRRRATTAPGHAEVVPVSLGQGIQAEAASASAGPAKRRAPRKRAAKHGEAVAASTQALGGRASDRVARGLDDRPSAADAQVSPAETASLPMAALAADGVLAQAFEALQVSDSDRETDPRVHDTSEARVVHDALIERDPDPGIATADVAFDGILESRIAEETIDTESVADEAGGTETGPSETGHDETGQDEAGQDEAGQDEAGQDETGHDETSMPQSNEAGDEAIPRHSSASPPGPPHDPHHRHGWVYAAMGLFLVSLLFGAWGVWAVFFSGDDGNAQDAAALGKRNERLNQEVSTLKRSDQISREANRDLQRTLAERDEEIAGLRADVAFYERFVGATGQRRGLSVHDLEMQFQSGEAWRFVATLTQNLNRGAVNTGRLTLSVEGTRNDRMERLPWARLRKQTNAPGTPYSFKYFQQVEGDVLLPKDFKPLRVIVRLVPASGAEVEQSFTWADTLDRSPTP